MAELASRDINLYVNAVSRTMTSKGVTKQNTDDFWTSDIAPILHPMWDSDKDSWNRLHVMLMDSLLSIR